MGIVTKARDFARKAHEGQFRKYINPLTHYFVHPERVAIEVLKLSDSTDEMVAAAYLHDVCEDCNVSYIMLDCEFGSTVTAYVQGLTSYSKQISISGSRAIRKLSDIDYLSRQCKEVKLIKLEDRYDNLSDIMWCNDPQFINLYCKETRNLIDAIGDVNPDRAINIMNQCENLESSNEY